MNKHMFSEAEKRFFLEYTYGHSRKEIGEEFERRFGLKLTENQIKKQCMYAGGTGRTGQFTHGNPYIYKVREPDGTEKFHQNGIGEYEVKIKVNGKWVRKHRYIWEQAYGEIPKGKKLIYKDGDRTNCTLENLVLIDDAVATEMTRRDYYKTKGELRQSCILLSELCVQMRKREENERRRIQKTGTTDINKNKQTNGRKGQTRR